MENNVKEKNNNKGVVVLLCIIIVILLALCTLFATGTISLNSKEDANENKSTEIKDSNEEKTNNSTVSLNQSSFEKIVDDELYILFGFKSLNEVTNRRKLTLVFNKLEEEYGYWDDDVSANLNSVSKTKVEEVFNETCLSKLGITHENFDVYEMNDTYYNRNNNYMSKRNLFIPSQLAKKVVDYKQEGNKYTLDVKYIFTNNGDSGDRGQYGYGSWDNLSDESKNIVEIYTYEENFNMKTLVPDLQKYLDENFDTIKDKLDTYHYTFEVKDNKIELIDFSIN